jgi:hypothetical protein
VVLRKAFDKGMQTNGSGAHVSYIEIYEPDVLAADEQSVLAYGASLFTPTPPHVPRTSCGTHCD